MQRSSVNRCAVLLAVVLATLGVRAAMADAFSFGIISDTQWSPSDNRADKGVPTEIIDDVNQQFIKAHVKFVIAVGDVTQNAGKGPGDLDELNIRAAHNAALTAAGIRFFPLRGNHEGTAAAADRFGEVFPNLPGTAGFKPDDGSDGFGGGSSPNLPGAAGKTYCFTYDNARFILLDQFVLNDGSAKGTAYPIAQQQDWITAELSQASAAHQHAFIFGHKNLLGQHHKDNLFTSLSKTSESATTRKAPDPGDTDPAAQAAETAFLRAMQDNGARYYFCGHDHIYHRAIVTSPEPAHAFHAQQIITGSDSYKFYDPAPPYSANEQPLVQERDAVGYTIVSVDGPKVVVRYYSVPVAVEPGNARGEIATWTPAKAWTLQDTFGYSLNGKEFLVKRGESFAGVKDAIPAGGGFAGTSMAILGGTNNVVGTTLDDTQAGRRDLANEVTTGWSPRRAGHYSDVLTIWGLRDALGSDKCDPYVLAMSYDPQAVPADVLASNHMTLCASSGKGQWVSAVSLNSAGTERFVAGPYQPGLPVGAWGINPQDHTVWAVLDHEGEFAVGIPTK